MTTKTPIQEIMSKMPDELQAQILALRERDDSLKWAYADLLAETYAWVMAEGIQATILETCSAVAIMLDTEESSFSLYNCYLVGSIIHLQKDRQKYEVLPFSHLLFARQYSEANNVSYKTILNYDLRRVDRNNGRPISRDRLAFEIPYHLSGDPIPDTDYEPSPLVANAGGGNPAWGIEEWNDLPFEEGLVQAVMYIERNLEKVKIKNATMAVLVGRISTLCRNFLRQYSPVEVEHGND